MADQPSARRRFQFRLRTLMIFVVAASFALAAMRFATAGWATATISITVLCLLFSIVLAACRRSFWIGFAICCGGYLVLFLSPFAQELIGRLFTTQVATYLCDRIHPESDYYFAPVGSVPFPGSGGSSYPARSLPSGKIGTANDYQEMRGNFRWIAHSLWATILGTLGGMLARFAVERPESAIRR